MTGHHAGPRAPWRRRRPEAAPPPPGPVCWPPADDGQWLPATMPGEFTEQMAAIADESAGRPPEVHHDEFPPVTVPLRWAVAAMLATFRDNADAMLAAAAAEWEQLLATYPIPEECP